MHVIATSAPEIKLAITVNKKLVHAVHNVMSEPVELCTPLEL